MKTGSKILGVGIVVIILIGFVYWYNQQNVVMQNNPTSAPHETINNNPNTTPTTPTNPTQPVVTGSKYKDGTYSVTSTYMTPAGSENLAVSLTLSGNKVTSAEVTNQASDRTSSHYQDKFISGFNSYVVGKNLDEISLNVVSGASLTTGGFNDALAQIKQQATN